ncbi:hypothetical protein QYE76_012344 [Lolium multiflorum]|uniref:Retrotransposon gag domain-containing protein n=1 Tax=Lolium multiflorum TaxID=4521 RepID=A0AAD8TZ43_LOLMU|nr:hypothetical protein QYE76_012344 [Lolium multiflorum]
MSTPVGRLPPQHHVNIHVTSASGWRRKPITCEDLSHGTREKYDDLKVILEAELIGSFEDRSHGVGSKDSHHKASSMGWICLSLRRNVPEPCVRRSTTWWPIHLHRHYEAGEHFGRVALRVMRRDHGRRYTLRDLFWGRTEERCSSTQATCVHNGGSSPTELADAAVYKLGVTPGDYQFLHDPPKEIPHGYVCTFVPDCNNWTQAIQAPPGGIAGAGAIVPAGRTTAAAGSLGAEAEKQAWLAKYATAPVHESSAATTSTADQISAVLRDQFGILPKKKIIGYSKPYPNEFDLIPLPPKYRLPDFNKFSGSEGSSSIEHVSRYLAQLGMASASDQLRVRCFSQSLTGPAFGWYTSLQPNSVQSWKQLEELFHTQYHSETTEAVELAVAGLAASFKDLTFQVEYNSLTHLVNRLTLYEQRHPELYQDKFKRAISLVNADEDEDSAEDQEVAFAMKVDMRPFPDVNMVDLSHSIREPGFSFDVNMAGFMIRHGADKAESSHSRGKDKEEAVPRDRPQDDDRRYLTEEEVRSIRYQRPLSVHLLNKYEQQYDRRRRYDEDDERYRRSDANRRYRQNDGNNDGYERRAGGRSKEQDNVDKHWDCPFFKHCWDSGMSRLPTIEAPRMQTAKKKEGK